MCIRIYIVYIVVPFKPAHTVYQDKVATHATSPPAECPRSTIYYLPVIDHRPIHTPSTYPYPYASLPSFLLLRRLLSLLRPLLLPGEHRFPPLLAPDNINTILPRA